MALTLSAALVTGTGIIGVVSLYRIVWRHRRFRRRKRVATLLDPLCADDALQLVERVSTPRDAAEVLACRLLRLYRRFPPDEQTIQAMSMEQQRLSGTGGKHEFAVCTVYAAILVSIEDSELRANQIARDVALRPL